MPFNPTDFVSPPDVIAATCALFDGEIDLDPASSVSANRLIHARKYFTPSDQGLRQLWKAENVYLYPPRDVLLSIEQPPNRLLWKKTKRFRKSAQRVWMEEMLRKYTLGEFKEGILFLTSTDVALRAAQKVGLDLPLCILRDHPKIKYDDKKLSAVNTGKIFGFVYYFPPPERTEFKILKFQQIFSTLGRVYI